MQTIWQTIQRMTVLRAVMLAAAGGWFLVAPYSVYAVVKLVLVVSLLAMAVPALIAGWQARTQQPNYALWRGGALLIAALLVAALLRPAMSLLPVLFGLLLVIYGINRITSARVQQQYINVSPLPGILYGVIVAAAGVFLLFNPFRTVMVMLQVVGALLIVMAVAEVGNAIRLKK
ncbi:DUF308 domain-containing protein [Lacticaseibacillus daqingensis]|uniref:DUF308 domain-containing protein n=1 Tax=Lacticaseibacillus daqingensis TaxID=2486014 RepID=UPI0013DE02B5|nr:DUF308 domain-containing protein [Lacticaseibacillus daqingensis]